MGSGSSKTIKLKYAVRPNNQKSNEEEKNNDDKNKEEKNNIEENKDKNSKEENIQDIKEEQKITVIIPLIFGVWEKSYNINTTLNQIASDFKQENNMNNIQKNFFIEFSFQNNPIDMDKTKLQSLINEDITTIHIAQEIKPIPGTENLNKNEIIDIVGKPFSEPFQIITFEIKEKVIKTIIFNETKIKEQQLDKYGIDSAYCNGNNYLYISGGLDQATNEIIGLFWAIDLKKKLFNSPIKIFPKKNHSMIYIEKKVYIIGGDSVYSMYYDVINNEIKQIANLNYKRFEPSLIKHDNFLFCFDTSKKYMNNFENKFNFEKIDLYSDLTQWEVVNPNISPNTLNLIFSQKFFGVVEDLRENIIFIGGIYDNDNKENDINSRERMNLQYNINKNTIEKSDIEYKDINFSEKTFYPFDIKTYYIIPNFNKRSPKIIYFYKDKNIIDIKSYHHKKKLNLVKISSIKHSFEGLNLNMSQSDDINLARNSLNKNIKDKIKLSNKDNNLTSHYFSGGDQRKNNEDKLNDSNVTIKEINSEKTNPNQSEEENNEKEKYNNNENKITNNEEIKSNQEKIKQENNKFETSEKDESKNENIKINNITNNEVSKEQNELKTEVKKDKSRNNKTRLFYINNPNSFTKNYHPNLDVKSKFNIIINNNYIKKNRMRAISPPIIINIKELKKRIKKINKTEFNEF